MAKENRFQLAMKIHSVAQPTYRPRGADTYETVTSTTKEFCIGGSLSKNTYDDN